ncbi:MAG TPA: EndoU domain-containing protein, partial [Thermoanaerobaculia bacterium]|nr:EndoU domain-containing protein [Thermoanaerobaculia bacterium]
MPLSRHRLAPLLAAAALLAGCFLGEPQAEQRASRPSRSSAGEGRDRSDRANPEREPQRSSRHSSSPAGRGRDGVRWSETDPPINLSHLFEGQINKRGKPVGFHARPGGVDPDGARLVRVVDGPNGRGVYVAKVEIRASSGRWLEKTSTLYPDDFSEDEVVASILSAFEQSGGGEKWRGDSGKG